MNIKATYKLTCKRCGEHFCSNEEISCCPACIEIGRALTREINAENAENHNETATLRDQFAMVALPVMLDKILENYTGKEKWVTVFKHASQASYGVAKEMMEARKK